MEKTPLGKYSPKKTAMAIEKGIEIMSAKKEVMSVPAKNGNAPNILATGFQVLVQKTLLLRRSWLEWIDKTGSLKSQRQLE
ncbi:hypothetical protein [Arachidicoccus ginsenosidivorans]|uniref:hypothetical protein n=1 Tax=Arachidicoccus ginsenosidivorans TaxID=496057 RepID=UPI001CEF6995|nr:hypothetical protein [Arachidicoccus ginsenosidivorans]